MNQGALVGRDCNRCEEAGSITFPGGSLRNLYSGKQREALRKLKQRNDIFK